MSFRNQFCSITYLVWWAGERRMSRSPYYRMGLNPPDVMRFLLIEFSGEPEDMRLDFWSDRSILREERDLWEKLSSAIEDSFTERIRKSMQEMWCILWSDGSESLIWGRSEIRSIVPAWRCDQKCDAVMFYRFYYEIWSESELGSHDHKFRNSNFTHHVGDHIQGFRSGASRMHSSQTGLIRWCRSLIAS
jgi:hypothetical protein